MSWEVEYTNEFEAWWDTLSADEQGAMSGHKPFKYLGDKLRVTPEGRAAAQRQEAILRDMLTLHKQREAHGVSQDDLAKAWDASQINVPRLEHEQDVHLSTLRTYIEALGGRLELCAVFPDQTVTLDGVSAARPDVVSTPGQQIA